MSKEKKYWKQYYVLTVACLEKAAAGRKRGGQQALWARGDIKGICGIISLLPSTLFLGIELHSCSKCPLSAEPSHQPDRGPLIASRSSFHCIDLTP